MADYEVARSTNVPQYQAVMIENSAVTFGVNPDGTVDVVAITRV